MNEDRAFKELLKICRWVENARFERINSSRCLQLIRNSPPVNWMFVDHLLPVNFHFLLVFS